MQSLHSHQAFDLTIYSLKQWDLPPHRHEFFELVYVIEGNGTHLVNSNRYDYEAGSLYLLTPHDVHSFEIHKESKFCIIVITSIYFTGKSSGRENEVDLSKFFQRLEYIFLNHQNAAAEPVKNESDKLWMRNLMARLIREIEAKELFFDVVAQSIVFLLLNQIARSIQENNRMNYTIKHQASMAYDIMSYIQQNIYQNEKLKTDAIANAFNKSNNYIVEYFKTETGETLKKYILHYKINLVKSRLLHSDLTISQIASELGFTDESHLNKLFKEREGVTAREFKLKNYTKTAKSK
jgi:AraC family transcriptional regulator, L-rhamnose operon regulatory protein RhaS